MLVAIHAGIICAVLADEMGRQIPGIVAIDRLNFYDFGAEVAQNLCAVRARKKECKVYDFQVVERLCDVIAIHCIFQSEDRKSVVSGKSVSVRVDLGGRRHLKKKKKITN